MSSTGKLKAAYFPLLVAEKAAYSPSEAYTPAAA
jgi:hypothetical protein